MAPLHGERHFPPPRRDGPFQGRAHVTWAEAAGLDLCQPTPDTRNRRIADAGDALAPHAVAMLEIMGIG